MTVLQWVGIGVGVVWVGMALHLVASAKGEHLWAKLVVSLLYFVGAWLLWRMDSPIVGIIVLAAAVQGTMIVGMRAASRQVNEHYEQKIESLKKRVGFVLAWVHLKADPVLDAETLEYVHELERRAEVHEHQQAVSALFSFMPGLQERSSPE